MVFCEEMVGLLSNVDGVDIVNYEKFCFQRFFGWGFFVEVYLVYYDSFNVINLVVVKWIYKQVDVYVKRFFLKEVKLFSGFCYENVV